MAKKTCPLCGGELKNNYCENCWYDVPDDDDLSAIYDMNPENDAFGEQVREITPEVQTEEIYPNLEPPKFKVRDEEGKTVQQNYQNQTPPPSPFAQQNRGNYNAPPNGGNNVPPPSPFANGTSGGQQSWQQAFVDDVKEFAKKYWWVWLILFLLPWWLSIIAFVTLYKNPVIDQKYRRIFVLSFIVALIFSP